MTYTILEFSICYIVGLNETPLFDQVKCNRISVYITEDMFSEVPP